MDLKTFEDELMDTEFFYECPYCHEMLKVKLSDETFSCTKCGSKFHTAIQKEDFKFNIFIDEDEDGQN